MGNLTFTSSGVPELSQWIEMCPGCVNIGDTVLKWLIVKIQLQDQFVLLSQPTCNLSPTALGFGLKCLWLVATVCSHYLHLFICVHILSGWCVWRVARPCCSCWGCWWACLGTRFFRPSWSSTWEAEDGNSWRSSPKQSAETYSKHGGVVFVCGSSVKKSLNVYQTVRSYVAVKGSHHQYIVQSVSILTVTHFLWLWLHTSEHWTWGEQGRWR